MGSTMIGDVEITWYGRSTFKIAGAGLVIYTDPYALVPGQEEADLILVTHEHHDHCAADKIESITGGDTVIVTIKKCASQLQGDVRTVAPGDSITVKGIDIQAVHAYNHHIPNHPRGNGVGFVFTIGGVRVYHTGDTDLIDEMHGIQCVLALIPIGGYYTMDQDEAVDAVAAIGPKVVIPMHHSFMEKTMADPEGFKAEVEQRVPGVEVRVLAPEGPIL
jgi:L-ascorbate metabolism protein UlaG (beta-lactamase superfamily)